jgi:WD40 repeat protein
LLKGPEYGLQHLAFSSDGKLLAGTSDLGELFVYAIPDGRLLYHQQEHGHGFSNPVFSPDGKSLAVCVATQKLTGRAEIRFLEPTTGRSQGALANAPAGRLAFSPDAQLLAAAVGRGVRVWDFKSRKELAANDEAHFNDPTQILVSRRGQVITAGEDYTIRVWDAATASQRRKLQPGGYWALAMAVSPNGDLLATSGEEDMIRLLAVDTGQEIFRLPGHGRAGSLRAVGFLPDGRYFLSWGGDFNLRKWDLKTGKAVFEHSIRPSGVTIPDEDNQPGPGGPGIGAGPAAFSPDGKSLLLSASRTFFLFDVETGKEKRTFPNAGGFSDFLAISPDSRHVLISQAGGSVGNVPPPNAHPVILQGLDSGKFIKLDVPGSQSGPVAFSADGRSFATATDLPESAILLYETATGQERGRIRGFPGRVRCLAFFPDGRRLASGLTDSTVLIWDLTQLQRP